MKPIVNKKEKIIQSAIELFTLKGFENCSIQEICDHANIGKGTLYLYFASKDILVTQVYLYCNLRNVHACDVGLETEITVLAKLCKRMHNAINWSIAHPLETKIERLYLKSVKYSAGYGYQNQMNHYQIVDSIICQGIENGELKTLPAPLLGEIFFGIGSSFLSFYENNMDLYQDAYMVEQMETVVYDSLKKTKEK